MFISLNTFTSIAFLEAKFRVHAVKNVLIDWNGVNTYLDSFEIGLAGYNIEPWMLPNLIDGVPLLWVGVQYSSQ